MNTCKVKCTYVHYNDTGEAMREYYISSEGKVWPCDIYANDYGDPSTPEKKQELLEDKEYTEMASQDPNWNDINYHNFNDIISKDWWWHKVWFPGWNNGDMAKLCKLCIDNEDTPIFKAE